MRALGMATVALVLVVGCGTAPTAGSTVVATDATTPTPTVIDVPAWPPGTRPATTTDFDGDGEPDVVAADGYTVHIRYGSGRTQTISTVELLAPQLPNSGVNVLARDLNGDGYCDLIVTQTGWKELDRLEPSVSFVLGTGTGLDPAGA